jgi:hypothetical protein
MQSVVYVLVALFDRGGGDGRNGAPRLYNEVKRKIGISWLDMRTL